MQQVLFVLSMTPQGKVITLNWSLNRMICLKYHRPNDRGVVRHVFFVSTLPAKFVIKRQTDAMLP